MTTSEDNVNDVNWQQPQVLALESKNIKKYDDGISWHVF